MKTIEVPEFVIYHTGDEWAALYADGKLVKNDSGWPLCGDSYHIDEYFHSLLGAKTIYSDAFLLGGNQRSDCAETIDEIQQYLADREADLAEAERLEAQARAIRSRHATT